MKIATDVWTCFLLLFIGLARGQTAWRAIALDESALAEQNASSVLDALNTEQVFSTGAIYVDLISVSVSTNLDPVRYYFVMDIDYAGSSSVFSVEGYSVNGAWNAIIPVPAKNFKATSPETLTSLADIWNKISPTDSLVLQGASAVDNQMYLQNVFSSLRIRPTLLGVVHAEIRKRLMNVELQYLQAMNADNQAAADTAALQISQIQNEIAAKLSLKKTALSQGDAAMVLTVDNELADLTKSLNGTLVQEQQSQANANAAADASNTLSGEITQAISSPLLGTDTNLRVFVGLLTRVFDARMTADDAGYRLSGRECSVETNLPGRLPVLARLIPL